MNSNPEAPRVERLTKGVSDEAAGSGKTAALPPGRPTAPASRSLLRNAGVVALMTLLSRLTGVLVQRQLGKYLGVGAISDAYQVAYRLPNMLRRFTAEGTMTAAFLPTLVEVEGREGEEGAHAFVRDFLGSFGFVLLALAVAGLLIMTPITALQMMGKLAPEAAWWQQPGLLLEVLLGRRSLPSDVALGVLLARLMFPYLVLVSLTSALAAVLNLRQRFALAASVSTFFNLTFLAGTTLCLHFGPSAWRQREGAALVFAFGVLAGGLVQLAVIQPSFRNLGFRWGFRARLSNPDVKRALRRMLPGLLAGGIHPINVLVSQSLASQLERGAQTVLVTSNLLGELVLGLFAVSVATVSLPLMSRQAQEGDLPAVRGSLAAALRGTALLALPGAVGMAVLAHPIVALIYQTGHFTSEAVAWTARTLPFQAVGLLFIASSRISTQALNALKDYRGPAQAAVLGFVCNILFSLVLMGPLGTSGMVLANSLSALAGLVYLEFRLRQNLGQLPYREVFTAWLRMGVAAACMGVLVWIAGRPLEMTTFRGALPTVLRLFPLMALGALAYFLVLRLLRVPEARQLTTMLRRRK